MAKSFNGREQFTSHFMVQCIQPIRTIQRQGGHRALLHHEYGLVGAHAYAAGKNIIDSII
ncbi:hypothetical protein LP417_22980 [Polaromonas sp. P1-6]|nr:hypothetical protein LP417_22980 [Polaromonas sp. P1-6]